MFNNDSLIMIRIIIIIITIILDITTMRRSRKIVLLFFNFFFFWLTRRVYNNASLCTMIISEKNTLDNWKTMYVDRFALSWDLCDGLRNWSFTYRSFFYFKKFLLNASKVKQYGSFSITLLLRFFLFCVCLNLVIILFYSI